MITILAVFQITSLHLTRVIWTDFYFLSGTRFLWYRFDNTDLLIISGYILSHK